MQGGLAVIGMVTLVLTMLASWADRRRLRRTNLDSVGFMPWALITIVGTLATLLLFALAIKDGQ